MLFDSSTSLAIEVAHVASATLQERDPLQSRLRSISDEHDRRVGAEVRHVH